ncbi:programmed cell death 6-interacting protein isoform X2 [Schistocerca nitens]|uniref:programmed cell death 6-interacting protein isoform X2 n=1 Tax=Schistocerca nitens TaxID=7011 RepID=UPI002118BE9A|nr:programmed cell death 6-interacting protein isoform X2 [Schistocerca nitens]
MADLLVVPLKKPSEVDLVKPLKNLISSSYNTSDKTEDYNEAINEFAKLRSNAVWRAFEKYESSLEVIYSYYDQLCALEGKIPFHEIQVPFKWKDAFDKGTLFGGRMSMTVPSFAFEKVCVLFNIAALQSAVAASQSVDSDEGLKLAAKLLQQAAGIFNYLKANVMLAIQQEPTQDLNPETLGALSSLMIAQAQEIFVYKAIHDRMKDAVVAKLSAQCEELYAEVMKLFQKELLHALWDRDWLPTVAGKQAAYHGISQYYQSLVCKSNKSVGEEIARLEHAHELLKAAQQRSGRPSFFQDFVTKVQRNLAEARKDNDFIYHERIPDPKTLPPVGKAALAKPSALPDRLSSGFKDLFAELVPIAVHQALAAYDVRKAEIVNSEVTKLRESTQFLNSVLASTNLPAALEDAEGGGGDALPQSVREKAAAVRAAGGLRHIEELIAELPALLGRNSEVLDEAERMLREEQESDDQLRKQFGQQWTRLPSERLTETFKANLAKYREILSNAKNADKVVRDKFEAHRQSIALLGGGEAELKAAVPAGGGGSGGSAATARLRVLIEQVETIKAERDVVEQELRSATVDMRQQFLAALAQGGIDEPAVSVESLGRVFGPLQAQVRDSLARQEKLVAELQEANEEFCKEKAGGGAAARREEVLKQLAAAHDAFFELQGNLREGTKFYNDLTQLLVVFQNKISDFCFARKTEKEELLKDLTQNPTRQPIGTTPAVPQHYVAGTLSWVKDLAVRTKEETQQRITQAAGYLVDIPKQQYGKFTEAVGTVMGKSEPQTGSTSDDKKGTPPPRPPPPSTSQGGSSAPPPVTPAAGTGALPYPVYPQGMPVPYGASSAAPYPTYVPPPGSFNPYTAGVGGAAVPYPHQPGYVYPFPQPPPYQSYPGYPQQQQQQQQQPPQNRQW